MPPYDSLNPRFDVNSDDAIVPSSDPLTLPSSPPPRRTSFDIPSSPPPPSTTKIRRPPPITPRSFRRFFTPRSHLRAENGEGNHGSNTRSRRNIFEDITSPVVNEQGYGDEITSQGVGAGRSRHISSQSCEPDPTTPTKKRKLSLAAPMTSSPNTSPIKRESLFFPGLSKQFGQQAFSGHELQGAAKQQDGKVVRHHGVTRPVRNRVLDNINPTLVRNLCDNGTTKYSIASRRNQGWQDEVANFYNSREDVYECCTMSDYGTRDVLPFCSAASKNNSIVAVGDEEGAVHLLDASPEAEEGFSKRKSCFQPHANSIMDLEFSADDKVLATASGDQACHVVDMSTQQPIYSLQKHTSSVKQVQFQPGSCNNVLATCSRDGSINIWDLRCKSYQRPSLQLYCSLSSDSDNSSRLSHTHLKYPQASNSILAAHSEPYNKGSDIKTPSLRDDISITSFSFLSAGRENLLVSGCAANASVRLWDMRTTYTLRRKASLSITRQPESHDRHRQFGLTSLSFNNDSSRLYTLCRDGTVYAYSTQHLVLGHSPELDIGHSPCRRFPAEEPAQGSGPLYGFRHPRLRVSTFFVKLSVRQPIDDRSELLAVGSSDNCAVVFPTDEKYMSRSANSAAMDKSEQHSSPSRRQSLRSSTVREHPTPSSPVKSRSRFEDHIPIYGHGAALIEGHANEVSSVSFTRGGGLATVSDDMHVRYWREGRAEKSVEADQRRCGWTDVGKWYSDDEVEDA